MCTYKCISVCRYAWPFIIFNLLLICLFCDQHFAGCTGYGHDEAGGREALDQAFAEIVGADSAIVRSQVCFMCLYIFGYYKFLIVISNLLTL